MPKEISIDPENFYVKQYEHGIHLWRSLYQDFKRIQSDSFQDTSVDKDDLLAMLYYEVVEVPSVVYVLHYLHRVVGYTSVFPISEPYQFSKEEMSSLHLGLNAYQHMQSRSGEVGTTAIESRYRGHGGWTLLMNELDTYCHKQFHFVCRWVREANSYADKVKRRYGNNIVFSHPLHYEFGPQQYFRIATKRE